VQWEKGAKEVVDLLKRVSDFFYNVILAFAIRHGLTSQTRHLELLA
jgi:hypothetical protein